MKKQKEEEQKLQCKSCRKEKNEQLKEKKAKAKREAAKAAKEAARVEKAKQKSVSRTKCSSLRNPQSLRVSRKIQSDIEAGEDADLCCVCFSSYQ